MRAAGLAVGLVAAVLLAGCGGGGSTRVASHGSSTTTTTTAAPGAGGPSVTVGIICDTPIQAAQAFVAAWEAGDAAAAGRCATPGAVAAIFTRRGPGSTPVCGGPDPGVPICTFTYPGGTGQLTLMGTEAAGWKVTQVDLRSG